MMTLFDALYINISGGKVLLEHFVQTLIDRNEIAHFHFLLDSRLKSDYLHRIPNKTIITPSESSRKKFYRQHREAFEKIFCFGNVPPPIKPLNSRVYVFFQNAHLLNPFGNSGSLKVKFKYFAKYLYVKKVNHQSYTWIVQTPHLQKLLFQKAAVPHQKILLMPFFEENRFTAADRADNGSIKFLYVASGLKQKNHTYLFDVWENLYEKHKINYPLYLTIDNPDPEQLRRITALQNKGINIINLGEIDFKKIGALYAECQYLVFPSFIESFGLPLVEATSAGCKILANDAPYVYEVIEPSATFNVNDINSLSEIVLKIDAGNGLASSEIIIKDHTLELIALLL